MEAEPPCQCILSLKLSTLRNQFKDICYSLDQQGWTTLCKHLGTLSLLDSTDIGVIHEASKVSHASPTGELILRMERKINQEFTVQPLLYYLNQLRMPQYSQVISAVNRLHDPKCRVHLVYKRTKILNELLLEDLSSPPEIDSPLNVVVNNNHTVESMSSFFQEPSPSLLMLESVNNLSDPHKSYLRIVRHPVGVTINSGESLMLSCSAESDQQYIHFSWWKDGFELDDQSEKILMLPDAKSSDTGVYTCEVWCDQSSREVSMPAIVKVIASLNEPNVLIKEPNIINEESISSSKEESISSFYSATDKFALLIANQQYEHNPMLASAMNDVEALASILTNKLNFKTVSLVNLNLQEMRKAVDVFCSHLIDGAYCVTYLAGHGFENDGQCYIVPVDAPKGYNARDCFSVKRMIKRIRGSCNLNLTVVLLDVCRRQNKNTVSLAEPVEAGKKSGNFVISFATMESGMAYEVKGRKLGVYVSCLLNHLTKDKRITRVLELVHKDMHKNAYTKGIQQPEFKSNIFEDRKLTDLVCSVLSNSDQNFREEGWRNAHVGVKPVLFIFESGRVKVELHTNCIFSNVLLIQAKIIDKGTTNICYVSISMKQEPNRHEKHTPCIRLEDLQRLQECPIHLPIEIHLRCFYDTYIADDRWNDTVKIPFISWWNKC